MSREKQVYEMANAMCNLGESNCQECANHWDFVTVPQCDLVKRAEHLYNAGYRKQEWISVDERLPEPQKLVLCIWERVGDKHNYGFARYQRENVWYVSNEGMPRVTHWMPLPEQPKGDRT